MNLRPSIPLKSAKEEVIRHPDLRAHQHIPATSGLCQDPELHGQMTVAGERIGASYIWLAYSVFFWIEPFFHHSHRYWLKCALTYAVFLALYRAYVNVTTVKSRIGVVVCFFLLGLFAITFNQGGSCFFVYVAAMLPFSVASVSINVAVMTGEILTLLAFGFTRYRMDHILSIDTIIVSFFIPIAGVSNIFVAQGKRADSMLRAAQEENVQLAALAERERIARDLHDVLGHTLSVIVLKSELAGRLLDRDPLRAKAEIADVERTARTALAEVREAIGGYRSKGLNAEVDQARLTLASAGVTLLCETRPPALPPSEETVLALAVREAVTNIVRHAHATTCTIRFATAPDGFASLEIVDNGPATQLQEGHGLRGMRQRVQALRGRFHIASTHGTHITIELPRTTPAALSEAVIFPQPLHLPSVPRGAR